MHFVFFLPTSDSVLAHRSQPCQFNPSHLALENGGKTLNRPDPIAGLAAVAILILAGKLLRAIALLAVVAGYFFLFSETSQSEPVLCMLKVHLICLVELTRHLFRPLIPQLKCNLL